MSQSTGRFKRVLLVAVLTIAAIGLGLCLLAVLVWTWTRHSLLAESHVTAPETGYQFPLPAEIARITVTEWRFDNGTTLSRFEVAAACWDGIIESLSPSQYDSEPCKWIMLGSLVIETKSGRKCAVDLYRVGSDPGFRDIEPLGAFSAGPDFESRKYYRGGTTAKLKAAMERAYAAYRGETGTLPVSP